MDDPIAVLFRLLAMIAGSAALIVWPSWAPLRWRSLLIAICGPMALTAAVLVSLVIYHQVALIPAHTAADRLALLALLGVVPCGLAAATPVVPRGVRWAIWAIVALVATPVLLHGTVYLASDSSGGSTQGWSFLELVLRSIVAAAVTMMCLASGARLTGSRSRRLPLVVMAGVSLAGSVIAMCSGSFSIGLANLGLTAALVGALIASARGAARHVARACVPSAALLQGAFMVWGIYMAEVRPWHAIMVMLAPAAALAVTVGLVRRKRGMWPAVIGTATAAAVALTPTVHALIRFVQEYNQPSGY